MNPHELSDDGRWSGSTSSDGTIDFSLFNPGSSIEAAFRALRSRGDFKELAEPNLVTLPGKEAFFLAGGEFPYPTVQGGGGNNAVSIAFREFGIMLRFTPTIMRNGNIRLKVVPEVSSLDFANALTFSGFVVPSLLTRRVETEVELKEGQHSGDRRPARQLDPQERFQDSRPRGSPDSRRPVPLHQCTGAPHRAAGHRDAEAGRRHRDPAAGAHG